MSLGNFLGRRLLKGGVKLLGRALSKPARLTEDAFRGVIGGRAATRNINQVTRQRVKTPAIEAQPQVGTAPYSSYNPVTNQTVLNAASPDYKPAVQGVPAVMEDYVDYVKGGLNTTGKVAQGLGYGGFYGGGAGLLGYAMLGDGTESAKDANGVKNPAYNEEMSKFRAKFQADKLGGDRMFSAAKYRALRQQSPWVNTAIEQIGKENYIAMKQALADGKMSAIEVHSALTDAIAELGDDEILKQAGTEPYVLPGLASKGQSKRVIVIAPMKGKKGNEMTMQALQYGLREDQQNQEGQQ
jgi:hypothetical protein